MRKEEESSTTAHFVRLFPIDSTTVMDKLSKILACVASGQPFPPEHFEVRVLTFDDLQSSFCP